MKMPQTRETLLQTATVAAVSVAVILIAVKFYAWITTGAISLKATLMDSVLDALASIVNFLAIRHSLKPADREHRFGHGKIEALAGLGQAAFITASAIFILLEAFRRLLKPMPIHSDISSIWIIIFSIVLTFLLVLYQNYVIKKTASTAIEADAVHYKCDLFINVGVLISLFLSSYFKIERIDPIFGMVISLYILWTAFSIFKTSLDILMDRELPDEEREKIKALIMAHPEALGFHDLRTRSTGAQKFIQLHLELPGTITLMHAHSIADALEKKIRAEFHEAEVIIHQDTPINR